MNCPECKVGVVQGDGKCGLCGAYVGLRVNNVFLQEKQNSKLSGLEKFVSKLANDPKLNLEMICPHCQVKGQVYTKTVKKNAGLDGAKVLGFLGGIILFYIVLGMTVTILYICLGLIGGFALKKKTTEANCHNCKATWTF